MKEINIDRKKMIVTKTNKRIYIQIIDETTNKTIVNANTLKMVNGKNKQAAEIIGKEIADKCLEKDIKYVRFDRNKRRYHGNIKSLADTARKNGLIF